MCFNDDDELHEHSQRHLFSKLLYAINANAGFDLS